MVWMVSRLDSSAWPRFFPRPALAETRGRGLSFGSALAPGWKSWAKTFVP